MSWLKRIISGPSAPQPDSAPSQIIRLDDQSYHSNSDILDGIQFFATLQIRTPLNVLRHHGEIFEGPPSKAPCYGSQAEGIWIFKAKTLREFGIALGESEFTHASDVGSIKPSQYLPFLVEFRSIVESSTPHEEKLAQISLLPKQSANFCEIWRKLSANYDDFPASFFYQELSTLPGIGRKLAKRLYEWGSAPRRRYLVPASPSSPLYRVWARLLRQRSRHPARPANTVMPNRSLERGRDE